MNYYSVDEIARDIAATELIELHPLALQKLLNDTFPESKVKDSFSIKYSEIYIEPVTNMRNQQQRLDSINKRVISFYKQYSCVKPNP